MFHILDLLEKAATEAPSNSVIFYGQPSPFVPITITYSELLSNVKINARTLLSQNICKKGSVILIHLDNHHDYVEWYWSVLATGAIPAISTPLPSDPVAAERHLRHLDKLLEHPKVLTIERLREGLSVVEGLDIVTLKLIADAQRVLDDFVAAVDQNVEYPPTPPRSEHEHDNALPCSEIEHDNTNEFVAPVGSLQVLALINTDKNVSAPLTEHENDDATLSPVSPLQTLASPNFNQDIIIWPTPFALTTNAKGAKKPLTDNAKQFIAPVGPIQILELPNSDKEKDISVRPVPFIFDAEVLGAKKADEAQRAYIVNPFFGLITLKQILEWRNSQAHIYATKSSPNPNDSSDNERRCCMIETIEAKLGYGKCPDEPAALMLTSGSTGNAKAVVLEHAQILASIQGKTKTLATGHKDVFFNWIGFDHVACLLESHLQALFHGSNQVHMSSTELLQDPIRLLEVIEEQKVTITFAPNFFIAMVLRACKNSDKDWNVDLSSLRHVVSGGEANVTILSAEVTKSIEQLGGSGDGILRTAFGMTETCAACTYNLNCPAYELERNLQFCAVGLPIESLKQRITSDDGTILPAREFGNLEVSGPMVFKRYYNNVIATADAFTDDGWFKTGDKGSIDIDGVLVLSGRTKDSLIVNGVKYFSHELEGAIEDANISGISPSYVAVFSVFPEGNDSEEIVVVFLPTAAMLAWNDAFVETISQISQTSMLYCSKRPLECIPLPIECLPKSALGKLSRSKLKAAYETGVFDQYRVEAKRRIYAVANSVRVAPTTATQVKIAELFSEEFGVDIKEVSTHDSLADMGIDSIQIIRFKKRLEQKLGFETQIPMISLLRNPSIEGIASELWKLGEDFTGAYEPVIELQSAPLKEARPPIFFIHPGLGEILVFLNLAKYFNDRAVYAIRAPGFNPGEEMFESLDEMTTAYVDAIRRKQRQGPYILCGYSFGGMIAFEIAKKLSALKLKVGFLASFNLPPHIKARMQQLDWIETVLTLATFLGLIPEETAIGESAALHSRAFNPEDQVLDWVIACAPSPRLAELDLDKEKLRHWAHLSISLHSLAKEYEPKGSVKNMDVFYASPLLSVGVESKEVWLETQLKKWEGFVEGDVVYHDCVGNHWTMLDGENCWGFQKTLKDALAKRGVL